MKIIFFSTAFLLLNSSPLLAAEGGFTWAHLVFGFLEEPLSLMGIDPTPILNMLLIAMGLIVFAYIGGRPFRKAETLEPSGRADFTNFVETLIGGIQKFLSSLIQHGVGVRPLFPLLATYLIFIMAMNLSGLVPGFGSTTDQFNITLPFALLVFVMTHYLGFKIHGTRYVQQFVGPIWWLAPLMIPIELISHLVRPLSLSVRLFGNMTGDHKVVVVFTTFLAVGLPIPFMGLGVLVSVLQAFVFVLLSAVYFESAMSEAH